MTQMNTMPPFPPGVTLHQRFVTGGVVYEFEHERLGPLGRLSRLPHGSGQSQIVVATDGDPDDPLWQERFALLTTIVRACFATLGKSRPLPGIEEARAKARLYFRFTHIQHNLEMWDFARGLSEEDYAVLVAVVTHSSKIALSAEAADLQLRLALLQVSRTAPPEARPDPANGLYLSDGTRVVVRQKASGSTGYKWKRSSRKE